MLIPMLFNNQRESHNDILSKLADIVGQAYDRLSSGEAMGKVVVEV